MTSWSPTFEPNSWLTVGVMKIGDYVLLKCLTEIEFWHVKPVAVSKEITRALKECKVNLFCKKLKLSMYTPLK